jgi:hypothetical protein
MGDPTDSHLKEAVDTPIYVESVLAESEPLTVGAGLADDRLN